MFTGRVPPQGPRLVRGLGPNIHAMEPQILAELQAHTQQHDAMLVQLTAQNQRLVDALELARSHVRWLAVVASCTGMCAGFALWDQLRNGLRSKRLL